MISFYNNEEINIQDTDLLLAFSSAGMSGTFAASLLINNHPFENIGFFHSEYINNFAVSNEKGETKYNGEVYYSKQDKITLINFIGGCFKDTKKLFFEEVGKFYQENKMNKLIIFGGIGKDFLNDTEINSKNVEVYFLSNDKCFNGQFHSMKSFENLVNIEDKKHHLQEMKFMEKTGTAKELAKYLHKNDLPFQYLFAYSEVLFDPQAGLALYFKLAFILNLKEEVKAIEKHKDNFLDYLEKLEKEHNLKFEPHWKLFLKE